MTLIVKLDTQMRNSRNFNRFSIVGFLVSLVFFLPAWEGCGFFSNNKGELLIKNASTQAIVNGNVEICGQHFKLERIDIGKTKLIKFDIKSDSHYALTVELEGGKQLSKNLGYVTNGIDSKDTIIVKSDDIVLEEEKDNTEKSKKSSEKGVVH